jgi:3-methyl-2-oxobutanoate hydroxymethyltransferase
VHCGDAMTDPTTSLVKLTLPDLARRRSAGERIAMVTAYDAPSARLADLAGVDMILVGDSAGTTVQGGTSTVPVTLDDMVVFTRSVVRGTRRALVVADMPFGSYQVSDAHAVESAIRLFKDAGADAVKVEGAGATLPRIRAIVDAGIPVMGHLGLTPQSVTMLGGYRMQGRTAETARQIVADAVALERAGCFSMVLEAVPAIVADRATAAVTVPTIGIGAGAGCTGQVLVWHDLLGLTDGHVPRFVKAYAALSGEVLRALEAYVADVQSGAFPEARHTYAMPEEERARFVEVDTSVKTT